MSSRPKRTPEPPRKRASGPTQPEDERANPNITIRCPRELAARARAVAKTNEVTLAQVLEAGVDAYDVPPRHLTEAEDEAACRADAIYERMREDDR